MFIFKRDGAFKPSDDLQSDYYHWHKDEYPSYKGGIYRQEEDKPDIKIAHVYASSWHAVVVTIYGQDKSLTLADLKEIEQVVEDSLSVHVDEFE